MLYMPSKKQIQRQILRNLCEEFSDNPGYLHFDGTTLVEELEDRLEGVEDTDIIYNIKHLDGDSLISRRPTLGGPGSLQLTPSGIDFYEELSGHTIIPRDVLDSVLELLYEKEHTEPLNPKISRDELLDQTDFSGNEIDRVVWYSVENGWLDALLIADTPWWQTAEITARGRSEHERSPEGINEENSVSITRRFIPDFLLERSFLFKTSVLITGAVILVISALLRPSYPVLWIPIFAAGALVEWFIIAVVYIEIDEVEKDIQRSESEINLALDEIEMIQREIEETQDEIESVSESIFSFISDSEGSSMNPLEDRISDLEDEVGIGRGPSSRSSLERRISDVESRLDDIERGRF